jgi:hypothetical protein
MNDIPQSRPAIKIKLVPFVKSTPNVQLQKQLTDLSKKYNTYLSTIAIGYDEYIKLDELLAKKDAPIGTGSSYMKELCKLADENKKIIILYTALKGFGGHSFKSTSSVARLKNFYKRFGFINNFTRATQKEKFPGDMLRMPKPI